METIYSVVRNLVFLVLVAAFLEMLLPMKESRRYLQVVMGLFVMLAVLNPVVSLFKQAPILSYGITVPGEKERQATRSILDQGKELRQSSLSDTRSTYIKRLEEEVAVLVRLVPGVAGASAKVELNDRSSDQLLGSVQRVTLSVRRGGGQARGSGLVTPVAPVRVGDQPGAETTDTSEAALTRQIQETVSSLLGLRPEQVMVKYETVR